MAFCGDVDQSSAGRAVFASLGTRGDGAPQWERDLDARPDSVKTTVIGRTETKTQKQCKDYIRPLFKLCKKKEVPPEILHRVSLLGGRAFFLGLHSFFGWLPCFDPPAPPLADAALFRSS
jgi:hypothetical protein